MENNFGYLPWEQRVPDMQYQNLLKEILKNGETHKPIHGEETKRITGYLMKFKRNNGFTMTPTRDLLKYNLLQGAMGENIGFMNGARTLTELANYGCPESFWKKWVTAEKCGKFGLNEGDLGPGSYGAAWAAFPKPDGTTFNQIEGMIRQMREVPMLRTILIDPWIPFYTTSKDPKNPRSVVVAPCHGWVHIHIDTVHGTFKPPGNAFCVFFGPTPASQGDEPRMASPGIPLGRIVAGASALKRLGASVRMTLRAAKD